VFAAVLILSLLVLGLYSLSKLGLDQMPNVDVPMISISTTMTGASPEEMDTAVTDVIEKQVNTISGIESISSVSAEGISVVSVEFNLEKNVDVAFTDVQAKVNLAIPSLPVDAKQPTVQKLSLDAIPVLSFTLSSDARESIRNLTEYADKTLRPQIESVSGVGQAQIVGGRSRQVNVTLDPLRLRAYGLTPITVRTAIGSQNVEVPGGSMDQHNRRVSVRTEGRFATVEDLKRLVVSQADGQPIYLKDVASVADGQADATSLARVNGKPTVLVQVQKQSGANTVEVVNSVKERLGEIASMLPPGYKTRITRDQSVFIEASVHTVEEHLVLGAILAAVVVLIFLWDIRATLISSFAIPTSIISAFLFMWLMGYTLNSITLLALTLSVGIVIDDAILVLENIYRFLREKDLDPREAALGATREIGLAVLATTLSLVAIFLPVAFMSGMTGRFMSSFGVTMSFAIMVSLLVAFTLTPMLSSRWLANVKRLRAPREETPAREEAGAAQADERKRSVEPPSSARDKRGIYHRVETGYWILLRWALRHRWVVIAGCVVTLLSSVPLLMVVNKEFIPSDDQSQFTVSLTAPEGTPLDRTGDILEQIGADIRKMPDVLYVVVTAGTDSQGAVYKGSMLVQLKQIKDRTSHLTANQFIQRVRDEVVPLYPGEFRITVSPPSMVGGGADMAAISYVVAGPELSVLQTASDRLVAAVRQLPGVSDVDTTASTGNPEIRVDIDRLRAADMGVSASDVASSAQIMVAGVKVSDFADGGHLYDINLRAGPEYRSNQQVLGLVHVPSSRPDVGSVALAQVASFHEGRAPATVNRYARQRQVTISVNLKPGASQQAVQDAIEQEFRKLDLGTRYTGQFSGMSKEMGKAFAGFITTLALSIIFVYLILAAQFESWVHPITILFSLPLSVPFALLSIWLTGGSISLFTMLGILVLFGMVKKNSILQVDHANQLREEGYLREPAVLNASRDRLRPILMTTIAFVAGMTPMALSTGIGANTNRTASTVIIGGQALSLLLSLVATPVLYTMMDDVTMAFNRARARVLGLINRRASSALD
jgi:HAE1 family hydrophobic/amphiphilic exporter-1